MQERPIIGDFEKYGLRGAREFAFQLRTFIPEKFMKGNLLESWEVTPEKIIWRIRPGIYWQDVPHIMKARELTAQDVVADVKYFLASPPGKSVARYIGDVHATDRYTAVLEFTKFDLGWYYRLGYEDRAIIRSTGNGRFKKVGRSGWHRTIHIQRVCRWFSHELQKKP